MLYGQVVSYSGGGLVCLVCVFLRGSGLVRWVCWLVLPRGCCQHLSFLVFGFWYFVFWYLAGLVFSFPGTFATWVIGRRSLRCHKKKPAPPWYQPCQMTNSCAAGAAQKNKKNERSAKHKVIAKGLEVGEAWRNVPYYKWRNTK